MLGEDLAESIGRTPASARSVSIEGVCILLMLCRLQDLQQQRCQAWHNVNHLYHVPGHWPAHPGEVPCYSGLGTGHLLG